MHWQIQRAYWTPPPPLAINWPCPALDPSIFGHLILFNICSLQKHVGPSTVVKMSKFSRKIVFLLHIDNVSFINLRQ